MKRGAEKEDCFWLKLYHLSVKFIVDYLNKLIINQIPTLPLLKTYVRLKIR